MSRQHLLHKKREVVNINIEGIITTCIVMNDMQKFHAVKNEKMLFMRWNGGSYYPQSTSLENDSHYINFQTNHQLCNCYLLLIGDERVWMGEYGT